MTNYLFHGTNADFDTFKISESFLRTKKENLMEGLGIYFSSNKSFAEGYGSIVYTVEVEEVDILDFTKDETIKNFLILMERELNIRFSDYADESSFISSIKAGQISVHNLYEEINSLLESNSSFYFEYEDKITYEEDCLFEDIKNLFIEYLKPIIKYYDSSFKSDIFICIKEEEKLKIISKEKAEG